MKLGMQVGLGPGHIVLDGDPATPHAKGQSPQFLAHICSIQMAGWINMPLATEVGLDPSNTVLDGDPPPQKGTEPQFSVHVYCGQTVGWIKMPLGTEVGLGPGHIVLQENPVPSSQKGGIAPNFRPMSSVAKRLDGSRCHLVRR